MQKVKRPQQTDEMIEILNKNVNKKPVLTTSVKFLA